VPPQHVSRYSKTLNAPPPTWNGRSLYAPVELLLISTTTSTRLHRPHKDLSIPLLRGDRFFAAILETSEVPRLPRETVVLGTVATRVASMICIRLLDHLDGRIKSRFSFTTYPPRSRPRSMISLPQGGRYRNPRCRRRSLLLFRLLYKS